MVTKQREGEEPSFYLIGPLRETKEEAEEDLRLWRDAVAAQEHAALGLGATDDPWTLPARFIGWPRPR